MPLFISDDEFRLIAHDGAAVAERADAFIRDARRQLDTVRAEADAASIAAEQTCALLEQKYSSLYDDFSRLQADNVQLSASIELRLTEIANAQADKHQLNLKAIAKDGEIERLSVELAEVHKAKRQLLELVDQKDAEIREKNATIQSYLDKIVKLTESNTSKEGRVHEIETELGRCRAAYNRVTQEKELLEKHNYWLNEELTAKVNSLVEMRRTHMDVEADLSSKLADRERQLSESSNSLKWSKERVRDLESRVNSLEEELRASKEAAAANEERFAAELSTASKLVELYKASSEEWSKKAGELEGVIKALETHLSQSENDYKEKLENEVSVRKELDKEVAVLRDKLAERETEIEKMRKANELSFLPLSSFHADLNAEKLTITGTDRAVTNEISDMIVPRVPIGISGTALAASLLRDGWSLAKMYEKYQEANDAFLHERLERKKAEATLKQVFHEIEEKVEMVLEERVEHERMVEAYTVMDQKLQEALLENDNLETTIRQLKAELKMRQRDCTIAQKEINDLQKQVTVLLKECQDVQVRCGGTPQLSAANSLTESPADLFDATDAERIISDHLLTFKDINGLVEQNIHLRRLVHSFSIQECKRDAEIRESFQIQLKKVTDDASAKVEAVLKRSEEQGSMIESLHSSVAMYKRLYEEERRNRVSSDTFSGAVSDTSKTDLMVLFEGSQEVSKKSHDELSERAKNLEGELATLRSELLSLRLDRDKMSLEANFARERLDSFMKEFDHQRQEANAVSARNVELTHLIVDYQRRLRECSDSSQACEDNSRKLSMEVSILKNEKEILINSEKRASDEVRCLWERVHRLQSTLDTIQSVEEVRENAKATEKKRLEDYLKQVEMEWAEAKKELQEARDHVRTLILDKEKAVETSARQVEEMRKELTDAWHAVASAESRAAVAEARCSDLEVKISHTEKQKVTKKDVGEEHLVHSTNEINGELWKTKEEWEKLKDEAQLNKEYMLQYKEIARTSEVALKQIESAHEEYKLEAQKLKNTLEDEVEYLRSKVHELESNYKLKFEESAMALESKEHALSSAMSENSSLRDEISVKLSQIETLEIQVSSLKDDVDREHKRWRTAQDNYERQIILQSETIQELTNTSKELSVLQCEITKLREFSEAKKTENELLKKSGEKEKVELEQLKSEAERKHNEVNEQNKILHNRLEALHIKLADSEHRSSGVFSQSTDSQEDNNLQSVVSYLRRSKEIAETEISLLKQEKLRLQSQLEVALKASENAHTLLRSQSESSQMQLFKDDEFKSLQIQVREINLLRESNVQLRAENMHNFEECQKFREEAQKAKLEAERVGTLLHEKEIELDACRKEIEMLKLETGHLNSRINELHESTKNIDIVEYEQMKAELQHIKVLLQESESKAELTRNLISEKEDYILSLEQKLAKCHSDLVELENKLNDALQAEAHAKMELDKQKKSSFGLKKRLEAKIETLTKEKDEIHHKNQALQNQIEDSKSSRKNVSESTSEQAKKDQEKDTRIQTLEKALERQKEELKTARDDKNSQRKSFRTLVSTLLQKVKEERTKVEEELAKHKNDSGIIVETHTYFQAIGSFENFANSIMQEGDGPPAATTESPTVDTSAAAAVSGRQVGTHLVRPSIPQVKAIEEREKGPMVSKPGSEVRKLGRRLIRPALETRLERPAKPSAETVTPGTEPSSVVEEGKPSSSHEPELSADTLPATSGRKRLASSSQSEPRDDTIAQDDSIADVVPSLKKSKQTEAMDGTSDVQTIPPPSETPDTVVQQSKVLTDISESQPLPAEDMETDQATTLSNDEMVDEAKAEEDTVDTKEETEDAHKETLGGTDQEDEVTYEGDAIMDELSDKPNASVDEMSDKPNASMELAGEAPKTEDAKDLQQCPVESEDEKEEGELMGDDVEQEEVSGGMPVESTTGEDGEICEEGADAAEDASPEAPAERSEEVDVMDEVVASDDVASSDKPDGNNNDQSAPDPSQSPQRSTVDKNNDQAAPDPSQSPQRSTVDKNNNQAAPDSAQSSHKSVTTRESSPASHTRASVSERRSPSPGPSTISTETDEPAPTRPVGRTISIAERARENARLRQQSQPSRRTTQTPPRGGGRAAGGVRREGTRGARGRGRGGQAQ